MPDERPIDDSALSLDQPLSVDVVRDLATNAIHVYRDRGRQLLSTAAAGLTSSEASYTAASTVISFRWVLSPWVESIGIRAALIDNGNVTARCRVGYIYGPSARASTVFPSADGDWVAGQYLKSSGELSLSKLVDNHPNWTGEVTIEVKCINDCEIYALSLWEVMRG